MTKVITYGTYDLLHYGHIKLLERAKALGDYLVVGVTSDDFDRQRGKINVQQPLLERIEAVRRTGLADEIIVEEYEGQKINDIKRLGIDIFTVGSDWVGHFDYLGEYCRVVYLDRTRGVSSTQLRTKEHGLRMGLLGENYMIGRFLEESRYVNGIQIAAACTSRPSLLGDAAGSIPLITTDYGAMLDAVDAVYIVSHPSSHYADARRALEAGKHVLCESPIALSREQCAELFALAEERGLVLADALKTAHSTAYQRMVLLAKGGKIGDVVAVDAVCTSLRDVDYKDQEELSRTWGSLTAWGPTALLPVFQLLGTDYREKEYFTRIGDEASGYDEFTKATFLYPGAVASIKVGKGVKSEGELVISGTKGYIYVPAPWWKTDYFEIRYENPADNRRYFYQLEGGGMRNNIVGFVRAIERKSFNPVTAAVSQSISRVMEDYYAGRGVRRLTR